MVNAMRVTLRKHDMLTTYLGWNISRHISGRWFAYLPETDAFLLANTLDAIKEKIKLYVMAN